MARKAPPIEPEWPAERRCEDCGARVYVVTSQDGEEITLDVDEMELRPPDEFSPLPVRRIARHPALRHVGGYRLLDPELFLGWSELDEESGHWTVSEPEWLWFATRTTLQEAFAANHPLHSEHMFTCREVLTSQLVPKLTNVAVRGDAAGDPRGKALGAQIRKARRIPLREDRLRELERLDNAQRVIRQERDGQLGIEHVRLLGEFPGTSARRLATGRELEADGSSDSLEQMDLF